MIYDIRRILNNILDYIVYMHNAHYTVQTYSPLHYILLSYWHY